MYKIQLLLNDRVIEDFDTNKEYYDFLPPIDLDNSTIKFSIKIKNLINSTSSMYPKILVFKSNLSPSVLISSGQKVSIKVSVNNGSVETFSSDKFATYTDDYVGIIFSEDENVILNFRLNEALQNKFILVPYTIKPQEEAKLDFIVDYLDLETGENFSRNKLINLTNLLYSVSKKLIRTIENGFGKNLEKFYRSYKLGNTFFIISPLSLKISKWTTKDLALFHLIANGIYKESNGAFNEFLLNYERNIISNLFISNTSNGPIPFFSTDILEQNDTLITSNELDLKPTTEYLNSLLYLLIYEFLKPYSINSNYIPTNTLPDINKIANLLNSIINVGFVEDEIKIYTDQLSGNFAGEKLNTYEKKKYSAILYLISLMFVEFAYNLVEKNILSEVPRSVYDLESTLVEHIDLYLDGTSYINSLNRLDLSYELDYILTLLAAIIIYDKEGKNIFKNTNKVFAYFAALLAYVTNITKFISEQFTPIDPNQESIVSSSADTTILLNQIFIIGFWNSISTHSIFNINLLDYFNIQMNDISFNYLTNRATITFTQNNMPIVFSNRIVHTRSGPGIILMPNISTSFIKKKNELNFVIDLNYFYISEHPDSSIKLTPKLTTRVSYLNYLNAYLKLLASKINNVYYFTDGASDEQTAILNMNTYAYLNYILLLFLNNKETQNTLNLKFSLYTV